MPSSVVDENLLAAAVRPDSSAVAVAGSCLVCIHHHRCEFFDTQETKWKHLEVTQARRRAGILTARASDGLLEGVVLRESSRATLESSAPLVEGRAQVTAGVSLPILVHHISSQHLPRAASSASENLLSSVVKRTRRVRVVRTSLLFCVLVLGYPLQISGVYERSPKKCWDL